MKEYNLLMHSYPEFPQDVVDAFSKVILKHRLKTKIYGIYSVNLENKYCRINLNMDRYDLQVLYFNKSGLIFTTIEDKPYGITNLIMQVLKSKDFLNTFPVTSYGNRSQIIELLNWYSYHIEKHLSKLLEGDFTILENKASL